MWTCVRPQGKELAFEDVPSVWARAAVLMEREGLGV